MSDHPYMKFENRPDRDGPPVQEGDLVSIYEADGRLIARAIATKVVPEGQPGIFTISVITDPDDLS